MPSKIDYKKEYKDLYQPGKKPMLIQVPAISFLYLDGIGAPEGEVYQNGLAALYAVSYGLKMSKLGKNVPAGYFEYVVPPLEGLWVDIPTDNPSDRKSWHFTSLIRQPEFVTPLLVEEAIAAAKIKKPEIDFSPLRFGTFEEGLCVQAMHQGPYATEPETLAQMNEFIRANECESDFNPATTGLARRHHEIYLGDPRKTAPEKLRTVLRHPVRERT